MSETIVAPDHTADERARQHPPGTIIIAAGEFLRYGAFVNSMLQTLHPPNTQILIKQSVALVDNLNDCIRKMSGDWIWIQSDDQSWSPDALVKLLDRQVDVVAPLILKRSPPYYPVAFKEKSDEGYMPYSLTELPETGLVPVHSAGSGGMLIQRYVLDDIGVPQDAEWEDRHWFTYGSGVHLNEDLVLCQRITEAGYDIYLDVEVQMGHRGSYTVLPIFENGRWGVGMNMGPSSGGKTNTIVVHPNQL